MAPGLELSYALEAPEEELILSGCICWKKNPNSGVGKVSMAVASFVFLYCLIFFQIETVVYSAIFTIAGAVVIDRVHEQNIKMTVVIITEIGLYWRPYYLFFET